MAIVYISRIVPYSGEFSLSFLCECEAIPASQCVTTTQEVSHNTYSNRMFPPDVHTINMVQENNMIA